MPRIPRGMKGRKHTSRSETVVEVFGQIYGAGAGTKDKPSSQTMFYATNDKEKAVAAWKRYVEGKGWTPIGTPHASEPFESSHLITEDV